MRSYVPLHSVIDLSYIDGIGIKLWQGWTGWQQDVDAYGYNMHAVLGSTPCSGPHKFFLTSLRHCDIVVTT